MNKKGTLYKFVVFLWIILLLVSAPKIIKDDFHYNWVITSLLVLNLIFIAYFWLNGLKDIMYVYFYYHNVRKLKKDEKEIESNPNYKMKHLPHVALLYLTCDDFIPDSLEKSMNQKYVNFTTYILDDSKTDHYKNQINDFVKAHPNAEIIRRTSHEGFKAGNLNNFLSNNDNWDYFVILDSDEIIPNDFIIKSLPYFKRYPEMGILQCNHISTRNENRFMKRFYRGVNAHWPTYQSQKQTYGFLSMLGHGAIISRDCFKEVGKFPEVVAEDISFTIEAKLKGYETGFARNIICEEQFPIDYPAFVKRQYKWVGGNIEFLKNYSKDIFKTHKLRWFEKLDILLFVYSLPLTYLFSLFLILNAFVFPLLGISPHYYYWVLMPTVVFYFSPQINDMIYNSKSNLPILKQIKYSVNSILLYGSMYYTCLSASIKLLFGKKPQFLVTPKNGKPYSYKESIIYNSGNIIFALILSFLSFWVDRGLSPVILIVLPLLTSVYLTLMSNHRNDSLGGKTYLQNNLDVTSR